MRRAGPIRGRFVSPIACSAGKPASGGSRSPSALLRRTWPLRIFGWLNSGLAAVAGSVAVFVRTGLSARAQALQLLHLRDRRFGRLECGRRGEPVHTEGDGEAASGCLAPRGPAGAGRLIRSCNKSSRHSASPVLFWHARDVHTSTAAPPRSIRTQGPLSGVSYVLSSLSWGPRASKPLATCGRISVEASSAEPA